MSGLDPAIVARVQRRVGTTLRNKYAIDALLGYGAAGSVYSATHRNGTRVALKVLHAELAQRADMRERFLREGYVANQIKHPGVVPILDDDDDDDDGTVFLVMELLDGETLDSKWARAGKRLPVPLALTFIDALLDVLAAAHDAGIVHRAVTPENVFVMRNGSVKVLGFGIARLLDRSGGSQSGAVFGTPAFMPPEQASGRIAEIDARSDVWSAGATLFTLLSGRHVHEAPHAAAQTIAAATQAAPPIGSILPTLDAGVAAALDRALAFASADRWDSARAMQAALRATDTYVAPSPDNPLPPSSRRQGAS